MGGSEPAIAWTAMGYRSRVLDADGGEIGTAESLLGDEAEDIFHGVAVRRKSDHKTVELSAERVKRITEKTVETDVPPSDVSSLPLYNEQRWFHIGWGGLFRRHPEWDSTSNP